MIHAKLQQARAFIKDMKVKKDGWNSYSEYHYFTPEQINHMVTVSEKETGLMHLFNLKRDDRGLNGHLEIIDIETGDKLEFIQATEIPEIKATNAAQQVGGAVTYTQRYMLMTAYDIADNSLDFDAKDNREQKEEKKPEPEKQKPIIPGERFDKLIELIKSDKEKSSEYLKQARAAFRFTDDQESKLMDWEASL